MADDIVIDQNPEVNAQMLAAKAEIDRQMNISLNGGFEPEVKVEEPIIDANAQAQQAAPIVEPFSILKEKFNYQTAEDAVREIEELRGFKANPITNIEFENEFSEKVFKAIQAGKTKEVTVLLAQQDRLESITSAEITKDNAEDVIKLGMSLRYKDLTPSEINYKFNKQFAIPKEPVQGADEEEPDFLQRKSEWQEKVNDIVMDRILEAKTLKPELEAAKSKLVLPEIETPIDENYIQWQKSLEAKPQLEEEISKEYKSFTPKSIETKLNFNDETNKIAFEFQFEPDSEGFNKAVENGLDIKNFWKNFVKSDGTPDRQKFLQTIYYGLNKDKYAMAAMTQAKNATIKAMLPDNSNSGMQRQFAQTQESSELDKQMQASLQPFQRQR
jgi:hypothetical protein